MGQYFDVTAFKRIDSVGSSARIGIFELDKNK